MTSLNDALNLLFRPFGRKIVRSRDTADFYLHKYASYEDYRSTQEFHNIRKIDRVWADEHTLSVICDELRRRFGPDRTLRGLCHGTRNGFEQNFISTLPGFEALGTDISRTATDFDRSAQWDFHDVNPEWEGAFDFVYSNSLDQAWDPRGAMTVWLGQIGEDGCVVLEHSERHGPSGASEMDPFGVRPTVLPYVLVTWFGQAISMQVLQTRKPNLGLDVWLFFISRTVARVAPLVEDRASAIGSDG